jgi:hypothetical protein
VNLFYTLPTLRLLMGTVWQPFTNCDRVYEFLITLSDNKKNKPKIIKRRTVQQFTLMY